MSDYQALLDRAVTLVQAESGFVVLCDPTVGTCDYVATHSFEPANAGYKDQMLFDLLAKGLPALINNSIVLDYLPPGVISTLSFRHIILVPLKREGIANALLWCDRWLKQGLFDEEDLATVVALVQQEGWG